MQPLVSNPDSDFQTRPRTVGVHKVASFCHQRPCREEGREGRGPAVLPELPVLRGCDVAFPGGYEVGISLR